MYLAKLRRMYWASSVRPVHKSESLERDHGVAAPVREPVITGDDRAHFIADTVRLHRVADAADGSDNELICREDKFRGQSGARALRRERNRRRRRSASAANASSGASAFTSLPVFGGDDQRSRCRVV